MLCNGRDNSAMLVHAQLVGSHQMAGGQVFTSLAICHDSEWLVDQWGMMGNVELHVRQPAPRVLIFVRQKMALGP